MKKWKVLKRFKVQSSKLKADEIIDLLLENRGLKTEKEKEEFLDPKDPYLLTPAEVGVSAIEIRKAIRRIERAIKNKEKVIVYGDYDTDGVCATAVMWETLHELGANVMPFIPNRDEGYGMKVKRIEAFAEEGIGLIITVDQGIVANEQIELANKKGVDVIITDHHLLGKKKPRALATIHTTKLAGCGVAWFFARELSQSKVSLDLATIGTITDMVPLLGPSRSLVKFGLRDLRQTKRPGLLGLYKTATLAQEKISAYEIGFIVGPRVNASGRMDDPMDALRLICTRDENRAIALAKKLEGKNRERQLLMEELTTQAREVWLKEDGKSNLIFIAHEAFHQGVMGLVAGKLMEEFYRPVVVIAKGEKFSRASARSPEGFSIIEAVRASSDILLDHGGHPRAAGFTIETEKIAILKERLVQLAAKELDKERLTPTLRVDTELDLANLNPDLYREIERMEPFGEGNPPPVFASRNLSIAGARTVGSENKHLKLRVKNSLGIGFNAIGFGLGNLFSVLSPEKPVDIAYNLTINEWNGNKDLELKIKDIR